MTQSRPFQDRLCNLIEIRPTEYRYISNVYRNPFVNYFYMIVNLIGPVQENIDNTYVLSYTPSLPPPPPPSPLPTLLPKPFAFLPLQIRSFHTLIFSSFLSLFLSRSFSYFLQSLHTCSTKIFTII